MKISIPKKACERALARAASCAPGKTSMPILGTVLVVAEGSQVTFSATDLYLGATATAEAKVSTPGRICLTARTFLDIVKAAPDADITIETEVSNHAKISVAKLKYRIGGMPADDFPQLPQADGDAFMAISSRRLAEVLELAKVAMSTDDTRPHLAGVKLEWAKNVLRAVSTDGHRLIKGEHKCKGGGRPLDVLIPHKGVHEVLRLAADLAKGQKPDAEIEVGIQVARGVLFVRSADTVVGVKLADEHFPPYEKVIPQTHEVRFTALRESMIAAVRRINVLANTKSDGLILALDAGVLRVSATNADVGEGTEEIDVDYAGTPRSVGVNAKYLTEALGAMVGEEVVIEQGASELDPLAIKPKDTELDVVAVVMPMRT